MHMTECEGIRFVPPEGDPKWLSDVRKRLWQRFSESSWRDLDLEQWRYEKPQVFVSDFSACSGALPSIRGGSDIRVTPLADVPASAVSAIVRLLENQSDRFGQLHGAVFNQGMYCEVAAEKNVTDPLMIDLVPTPTVSLVIVRVAAGSHIKIVEQIQGGVGDVMSHHRVICLLERDAKVSYVAVQNSAETVRLFQHHHFVLEDRAELEATYLPIGGSMSRWEQVITVAGQGVMARTNGLTFGHGDQKFHFQSLQSHDAGGSHSELFFRNVVADRAKSIFVGNVFIHRRAAKTVANQSNKNLLLSESAEVITVPNLEIDTEDVQCGHGATVATLSEEEVFYLQSRGVSRSNAVRMIVTGFFAPILDRLPEGHIRDSVSDVLSQRLQAVHL